MRVDYTLLTKTIDALIDGETDPIAKMATIACDVHHSDDRFDWTGFYRVVTPELLKIGPYQGGHGCLVCLLYTSPSPRDRQKSRMPSSA